MAEEMIKPRKERFEVGLTEDEARLVKEIADSEGKAFAELLGELVRLGLPVKLEALNKAAVWRKIGKRDKLYQRLTALSEDEIDQLLNSEEISW